jgi:hypothetical protein
MQKGLAQDFLDTIPWASRALELREEEPNITPEEAVEQVLAEWKTTTD